MNWLLLFICVVMATAFAWIIYAVFKLLVAS